ncbi:hypothetical protein EDD22DRAFT_850142 [Suillus occidentalis]|nr:hypothetical protein EDD22DRAFT_850142 [Suillus occidentalis]
MSDLSFAEFSQSFSPPTLVPTLNALLAGLSLPFGLTSPTDLAPSLLLAILESILESRLPIPASIRTSRSSLAKVEAMKVFLGVLECDVLPATEDIGLADLDPGRLADGCWEETVFVGELLCWLGRKRGIIDAFVGDECEDLSASMLLHPEPCYNVGELSHITDVPRHPRVASPSARSTATMSVHTDLSMRHAPHTESDTSMADSEFSDRTETQTQMLHDHDSGVYHQPHAHCIHELEDPSYILNPDVSYTSNMDESMEGSDPECSTQSTSSDEQPPTPTPQPIRLKGWIGAVDSELEMKAFAANRCNASTPVKAKSRRRSSGLFPVGSGSCTPTVSGMSVRVPASAPSARTRVDRDLGASPSPFGVVSSSGQMRKMDYGSPTERTVALLNERARLLRNSAAFKMRRHGAGVLRKAITAMMNATEVLLWQKWKLSRGGKRTTRIMLLQNSQCLSLLGGTNRYSRSRKQLSKVDRSEGKGVMMSRHLSLPDWQTKLSTSVGPNGNWNTTSSMARAYRCYAHAHIR